MSTKGLAVGFVLCLLISAEADDHFDSITTTDGKTFEDVTVKRSDPEGLDIFFSTGAAHISFNKLPKDIQDKYDYSPEKAAAFKLQKDAAAAAAQAQLQAATKQQTEQLAKRRSIMDLADPSKKNATGLTFTVDRIVADGFISSGATSSVVVGSGGNGDGRGPAYYRTISNYDPSTCLVTEIDTSKLASNQEWSGLVYKVGIEKRNGEQMTHYTADLKAWAAKQGVALK